MAQLVTRVPDDLVAQLDGLVADGVVATRSEGVRVALEQLIDRWRREEVGRQIVAGYEAVPQTDAEGGWADDATRRMIAEEPW